MNRLISLLTRILEGLFRLLGMGASNSRNEITQEKSVREKSTQGGHAEAKKELEGDVLRKPSVLPDGTHEYPVVEVSIPEFGMDGVGEGWVRWHPMRGVSFEIENKGKVTSKREPKANRPAAGQMREISQVPQLTGRVLGMDTAIELFELSINNSHTLSIRQGVGSRTQRFTGRAPYATLELPIDHEFAYSSEAPGTTESSLAKDTYSTSGVGSRHGG